MADPLSIMGVVYPIARDLLALAQDMRRLYKGVRYAKHDLYKVNKRTETVARTYIFFSDTMKDAKRIKELAPMFKRHRKLIGSVKKESKRIIGRLKRITNIFWFLMDGKRVNPADKWIAQFEWFRESRKVVPSLFQDMKVLEKSMRTIGILVNAQMLHQVYRSDRSNAILTQLKSFEKILDIEFNKLQHAQHVQAELLMQHRISLNQGFEPNHFAQEVFRILKEEISRLHRNKPPDSTSTYDSESSSISPVPDQSTPITSPSTPPHHSGGDQAFLVEPQAEEISLSRPKVLRRRTRSEPPQRVSSISPSPSLLSSVAEVENQDEESPEERMHEQDKGREKEGAYMQMPPFGPPKLGPRPRAGRRSPDYPDPSGSRRDQQKDSPQRHGESYSIWRRQTESAISVYGNEGEVTPTHKTGFVGLPPKSPKGKSTADQ